MDLVDDIAPRPLMLIHAVDGQGGEELNEEYYAAAREPKELWAVSDGGHIGAQAADPEEFERRVIGFFDAALLGPKSGQAA